jgi:tetratricopeptide (TPR) repeat protein
MSKTPATATRSSKPARDTAGPVAEILLSPRKATPPGKRDPLTESLLSEAAQWLVREEYEQAEKTLARALKRAPEHTGCLACLALCQAEGRRRFVTAEKLACRAVRLAPTDAAGYYALGRVYLLAGRTQDALLWLERARRVSPRDPRVRDRLDALRQEAGGGLRSWTANAAILRRLPLCGLDLLHSGKKAVASELSAGWRAFLHRDHHLALVTGMVASLVVWLGLTFYGQSVVRRETLAAEMAREAHRAAAMAVSIRHEFGSPHANMH